jgi:hypothetical protein
MRLDQAVTGRSPLFDQTTPMHPLLPRLQSRYQLGTVRAPEKYLPDLGAFRTGVKRRVRTPNTLALQRNVTVISAEQ